MGVTRKKPRRGKPQTASEARRARRSAEEVAVAKVLGRRVAELRRARGWKQIDLEAHLDEAIKRATISDVENGREMPSLRTIVHLARVFEVHPAELLLDVQGNAQHSAAARLLHASRGTVKAVADVLGLVPSK
ncbi:MAG TPA: helix-turn-helix transcriptional regulator [Nannocystaceae bacterium]|nr:helix-turn-helix transcriptional regulator [Nannocystaceae bacterium]